MIVANLNALREWQRVRESTEPEIPDVERNPGAQDADEASLEDGSHGRVRGTSGRRKRRRRWHHPHSQGRALPRVRDARHQVGREGDEILLDYEDELDELEASAPPERGLIADYKGQNVDIEG
jgi:hypothetical protein